MKEIFDLIQEECNRQNEGIELIASENYASKDVRMACGSILTNKYSFSISFSTKNHALGNNSYYSFFEEG